MGILDRLLGRKAESPKVSQIELVDHLYPYRGTAPRRGTKELIEAYRTQPWLRAVTGRIADAVSSVSWKLYAVKGPQGKYVRALNVANSDPRERRKALAALRKAGQLEEVLVHPLLDLLSDPCPVFTGSQVRHVSQVYLDVKGEGFLMIGAAPNGLPTSLWPLPPHWVTETPSADKPFFKVSAGTLQLEVPEDRMLWQRNPNAVDPYGRGAGVGEALGDELETDEYAAKHLKSYFLNRAIPDLLIAVEGATEKQLEASKTKWENDHRGVGRGYRSAWTGGKMNVVRLDSSLKDMQMIELRRWQRDMVVQVFGIPPETVGIIENSNRATTVAAFAHFAEGVVLPRLERTREFFQKFLVPRFDERIVLDYESPIPSDKELQLKVAEAAPWTISQNEWRELGGWAPVEGGDDVFAPMAQPGQDPGTAPGADDGEEKPPKKKPAPAAEDDEKGAGPVADPPWVRALPSRR